MCCYRRRQLIMEVLGDGAIEKYGRDDLYEVVLDIKPFSLIKACKWSLLSVSQDADLCGTTDPLQCRVSLTGTRLCPMYTTSVLPAQAQYKTGVLCCQPTVKFGAYSAAYIWYWNSTDNATLGFGRGLNAITAPCRPREKMKLPIPWYRHQCEYCADSSRPYGSGCVPLYYCQIRTTRTRGGLSWATSQEE